MRTLHFNIVQLTICLTFGILLGLYFPIAIATSSILLAVAILVLVILHFVVKKKIFWFNLTTYLAIILIGIISILIRNPENITSHYSHKLQPEIENNLTFKISEILKPNTYNHKYVAEILKINNTSASGNFLLNIEKDSTGKTFNVDEIYKGKFVLREISEAKNPFQFSYRTYLEKQYIYHQVFTNQTEIFQLKNNSKTLFGFAATIRKTIDKKLQRFNFKKEELAIINALFLGQRQDISKSTYESYSKAGAIHILAISGLHVGIILVILNFIFKPIERLKNGKCYKTLIILILLWSFALIAGLSPSVTRAVTMFSIVVFAINLNRPTNIYNTLFISLFVLLLFKPMFLFDVGFQLSYAAVFAIVWLQPLLYKLWIPKLKIFDFFWNIFTVSQAAQIGVLPLSLFYFHQFPGLFFVTNLIILPFLGFILGLGFLVIVLALCNLLPDFLAEILSKTIVTLNQFVTWIASFDDFVISDISFNLFLLIPIYLLIISWTLYFKKMNFKRLQFALVSILILQGFLIYKKYNSHTESFTVFNKNRFTIIGKQTGKTLAINHDLDSLDNTIRNYIVGNFIKTVKEDSLKNIYTFKNENILVIDSLGIYNVKRFKPDYVLLRNSPKINLERLIDSIKPKLIIADASNYKSYVLRWKATCKKKKLPFHSTYEKGAFVLE